MEKTMEKIVALAKARGCDCPGSEEFTVVWQIPGTMETRVWS